MNVNIKEKFQVELSSELRDKHQASDQQWMQTIFTSGTINDKVKTLHIFEYINKYCIIFVFDSSSLMQVLCDVA